MELQGGMVAVVTGAASGIGRALTDRFAGAGLSVVMADVEPAALETAAAEVRESAGAEVVAAVVDVRHEDEVAGLAATTIDRLGAVHVVCNNAGVAGTGDPWFGPLAGWEWIMGVNFWGVVHGVRAFLPHLLGGGHIVNTASIAGLYPGLSAPYDASKHAVVAVTENLYLAMRDAEVPVGVSCLCPGWVRTRILDAERNWPGELGAAPERNPLSEISGAHVRRAVSEGLTPAAVADRVADAIAGDRFWVFPDREFFEVAVDRFHRVAEQLNPEPPVQLPGMPPRAEIVAEVRAAREAAQ